MGGVTVRKENVWTMTYANNIVLLAKNKKNLWILRLDRVTPNYRVVEETEIKKLIVRLLKKLLNMRKRLW